jgi:hypothetical protein
MNKKQKPMRTFVSLSSSHIAILFMLLIFSLSLSIITILYVSPHQQAMAQTNATNATTPAPATNVTARDFLTYENSTYGIKIQYPANWQIGVPNQTSSEENAFNYIVAFRSPKDRVSDTVAEILTIAIENLPPEENISLATYSTAQIIDLRQIATDFDLEQSTPTVLAGRPAYKLVYGETFEQIPLKRLAVWTIKDNKVYILTFGGEAAKYSSYFPTIQKMVDSFELINSTSTRGSNNSTTMQSPTTSSTNP